MNRNEREKQIIESIHSFDRQNYSREELLPEFLKLQDEVTKIVFVENECEKRIKDASFELMRRLKDLGIESNENMGQFIEDSKFVSNNISAFISGNRGEYEAFKSLETIFSKNRILKNIELEDNGHKTEIDAIVLTPKCAFIVEVKNSKKNIVIDKEGNFYRINEGYASFDQNIGCKMNDKAYLLKRALEKSGYYGVYIEQLVVFTNPMIKVTNNYQYLKTCSLASLPRIIDGRKGMKYYSDEDLDNMCECIERSKSKDEFNVPLDIAAFKKNFAELVSEIEELEAQKANKKSVVQIIRTRFKKISVAAAVVACALTGFTKL